MNKVNNVKIGIISRNIIYRIYRNKALEKTRFYDTKINNKINKLKYKTH